MKVTAVKIIYKLRYSNGYIFPKNMFQGIEASRLHEHWISFLLISFKFIS